MYITRLLKTILSGDCKCYFGQWAEDVLVRRLFPGEKTSGIYLDIGAYHPFKYSNTAYLWLKGWHGVNVDANPKTIGLFNKIRKNDINICAAVITEEECKTIKEIDLSLPSKKDGKHGISAIATCCPKVALERNFKEHVKIPTLSINQIISENKLFEIDYLNIDIEGYDERIIKDFDFSIVKPKVISIEDYSENMETVNTSTISNLLSSYGYNWVARVGLTSIFAINELRF